MGITGLRLNIKQMARPDITVSIRRGIVHIQVERTRIRVIVIVTTKVRHINARVSIAIAATIYRPNFIL